MLSAVEDRSLRSHRQVLLVLAANKTEQYYGYCDCMENWVELFFEEDPCMEDWIAHVVAPGSLPFVTLVLFVLAG